MSTDSNSFTAPLDLAACKERVIGKLSVDRFGGNIGTARHFAAAPAKRDWLEQQARLLQRQMNGTDAAFAKSQELPASKVPGMVGGWRWSPKHGFLSPSGHYQSERIARLAGCPVDALKRAAS